MGLEHSDKEQGAAGGEDREALLRKGFGNYRDKGRRCGWKPEVGGVHEGLEKEEKSIQ